MKNLILILGLLTFFSSCENGSNSEANKESNEPMLIADKLPCDLITEAEIKTICGIPENIKSTIENKERTYLSCFYKWEEHTYNRVMQLGGNNVDIPVPVEMSIVPVKNATKAMFETSTKVYKDGEIIDGIGDMAIWGSQMSQITFLAKGQMIHLHLDMSDNPETDKEMALKIAAIIVKNI